MSILAIAAALSFFILPFLMLGIVFSQEDGYGNQTQSAGTRITQMVQGKKDMYTYIRKLSYKAAGTAHLGTIMRKVAETTLSAAASASQAVIALTADPGSIAANDHLAIKKPDGTWHHGIVSSVATLNITLTANVPTGGFASGARVIFYGAPTDSDHDEKEFELTESVTSTYPKVGDGVLASSKGPDEPLIFTSDNATNAGELMELGVGWGRGSVV